MTASPGQIKSYKLFYPYKNIFFMALVLGSPQGNPKLDGFLVGEGYKTNLRLYHRVIGCWCGGKRLSDLPTQVEQYRYYQRCEKCGSLLLRFVLSEEFLPELYGTRYYREHQKAIGLPGLEERYENDAYDRIPAWIEIVEDYCKEGRVLEVGSTHGRFLEELSERGFDVMGLELDSDTCVWSRKKTGCDIRCETVDNLKRSQFDIIIATDVLEHLYDPRSFIKSAAKALKPGGRLLLQTVIFYDWAQCPLRVFRPLFHTILFSKRALKLFESEEMVIEDERPSVFDSVFVVFLKK